MQNGMTLVIQTGLTGLVGRTLGPLTQLSRLNSRQVESSPASVSTSSTYRVITRKCYSARLCFRSPEMVNILLGRPFMNRAWPRGPHWVTKRFGFRLTSRETLENMWLAIFCTMAGGCWSAKWSSNQVLACLLAFLVVVFARIPFFVSIFVQHFVRYITLLILPCTFCRSSPL